MSLFVIDNICVLAKRYKLYLQHLLLEVNGCMMLSLFLNDTLRNQATENNSVKGISITDKVAK